MPRKNRKMPASARPRVETRVNSFTDMAKAMHAADVEAAQRLKRSAPLRNRKAS